jgi:tetratricopeptide (TPR) repeat protein
VGYGPPADKHLEKIKNAIAGIDTYGALTERYAKEPANIEVIFKLAEKCGDRYSTELTAKSQELYKKIVALDPEGKQGGSFNESVKAMIPYTQAAEYALGQMASSGRKPDPAPLRTFIARYPDSKLIKNAYANLSYYYGSQAGKDEAAKFFEEYTAKYPEDRRALSAYVGRIIKDKDPVDKGIVLAERLQELTGYPQNPDYQEFLAQLYVLKNEPAKAEEEYGKDFAESYTTNAVFALTGYANFWIEQGKNLESAEEMTDLVASAVRARKDAPSYLFSQVAGIYAKLKKSDKALGFYGPEYAKTIWDEPSSLASYAGFWSRQGANLESAVATARRSVELKSDYYNNFILGQILFKAKNYPEALKAAEKAVELVKPMAAKYEGFPTFQYEGLVKQIKEAMAKK